MHRRSTADRVTERPRLAPGRPGHRWLRSLLALIGMIVLADALIGEQSLSSGVRARKEYQAAGVDLVSLRDENARLREEVRRLREDPEAIEYVARKDLGLARRGEILVVLK
jgi:cell division protein FtsB